MARAPKYSLLIPVKYDDKVLQRQFKESKRLFDYATKKKDYSSVFLDDAALEGAYINQVVHGLDRIPSGWKVLDVDKGCFIWESQAPDSTYLYIACTTDCTVNFEVF